VLQPGAVAVSGPQRPEAAAVLRRRAVELGAELRCPPLLDRQRWPLGLSGAVQSANGAVALGMLQALAERGWPIDASAIRQGFAAARWPGRLQPHRWQGIPLLLDGAHNPAAARALRAELDSDPASHGLLPGPRHWVLGMLAAKQGPAILEALLGPDDRAWIVPVTGHSSWTVAELGEVLATGPQPRLAAQLQAADDPGAAIREAVQATDAERGRVGADGGDPPVIVAGSLYLIGQLLADAPGVRV
jgi:dihydrofolate synthase/folylpolyglutamate synthase